LPYAGGFAIILFTVAIKGLTFPLTYKQLESTTKMQAMQPKMKKIQTEYKDNPQVMNQMIAAMYKDENINPLAGCLPVLVQLPIWIALYRAIINMANENILDQPFFFLPSLQGPVATMGQGIKWLYPLVDGAPPIGWNSAIAYLVCPVVLVLTQVYSQRVMSPPSDDPAQKQTQQVLQFLPLLFGYFALSVPSALSLYWVTNNVLSTAQTVGVKALIGSQMPAQVESSDDEGEMTEEIRKVEGFSVKVKKPKKISKKKK